MTSPSPQSPSPNNQIFSSVFLSELMQTEKGLASPSPQHGMSELLPPGISACSPSPPQQPFVQGHFSLDSILSQTPPRSAVSVPSHPLIKGGGNFLAEALLLSLLSYIRMRLLPHTPQWSPTVTGFGHTCELPPWDIWVPSADGCHQAWGRALRPQRPRQVLLLLPSLSAEAFHSRGSLSSSGAVHPISRSPGPWAPKVWVL